MFRGRFFSTLTEMLKHRPAINQINTVQSVDGQLVSLEENPKFADILVTMRQKNQKIDSTHRQQVSSDSLLKLSELDKDSQKYSVY